MDKELANLAATVVGQQVGRAKEQVDLYAGREETIVAMRAALELNNQMPEDLCGEQREFGLPRIRLLAGYFLKRYPRLAAEALTGAVNGYGDPILGDL